MLCPPLLPTDTSSRRGGLMNEPVSGTDTGINDGLERQFRSLSCAPIRIGFY